MSQTLALIVAASVLMMTALTVIMMTQGGLSDTFQGSNQKSCYSSIESTCQFADKPSTHALPKSCERAGVTSIPGDHAELEGDQYRCVRQQG